MEHPEDPKLPPTPTRFDDMPLSAEARAGLKSLGYELATPVQAATFGPAMAGRDLVVQSKTGTGKTTAFGLPLIERVVIDPDRVDPQVLILCPTRELAGQVAEELAELGDPKGVRVMTIYGGTPMGPQLSALKAGADIIVGTPGRVLDHVRRRTLRLVHTHLAVLDEADEMLSMGFWDDVTAILDQLPSERQTFLFSATLPDQIRRAAAKYLKNPERLDLSRDELTVEGITNVFYERDDKLPKPRNLLHVLEVERPDSAVIFTNTRDDASVVAAFLRRQGLNAYALSGELSQKDRERIMGRMKRGELRYLIATDIAARGIDISDLSHVFNYSLPEFTEVYIHRVGRTGRIGKRGTAVSLVGGRDEMTKTLLERDFGVKFEKRQLPPTEELTRLMAVRVRAELLKEAREVELTSFLGLSQALIEEDGGREILAFLLKRHFTDLETAREAQYRSDEARLERERERPARPSLAAPAEPKAAPPAEEPEGEPKARGRRPRRRRDEDAEPHGAPPDAPATPGLETARLFVNRGRSDGYDEAKLSDLLKDIAGGPEGSSFARIELRRTHAFVEAVPELADKILATAERGVERDGRPVTIERARTR